MAVSAKDPFSFDIQIDTVTEDRAMHQKNKKGEVQRHNVIDDRCRGLRLQARIDRIVHGHDGDARKPATLVVFGFRFHGLGHQRRFRRATITVIFRDAQKRDDEENPVVVALWPNGDFILGDTTDIAVEVARTLEAAAKAGGDQAGFNASAKWERKQGYKKKDRATLTGSIVLEGREYGDNNAICLDLGENAKTGSGLVTDFRAAVLLHRSSNEDGFHATVKVEAEGGFLYDATCVVRKFLGLSPPNDAVLFKPGPDNQYLRPPTGALLRAPTWRSRSTKKS